MRIQEDELRYTLPYWEQAIGGYIQRRQARAGSNGLEEATVRSVCRRFQLTMADLRLILKHSRHLYLSDLAYDRMPQDSWGSALLAAFYPRVLPQAPERDHLIVYSEEEVMNPDEAEILREWQKNGLMLTTQTQQRASAFRRLGLYWEKYCRDQRIADVRAVYDVAGTLITYTLRTARRDLDDRELIALRNALVRLDGEHGTAWWFTMGHGAGRLEAIPPAVFAKVAAEVVKALAPCRDV